MSPVYIGLSLLLVAMVTAEQKYMAVFPKELRNGMNFDIEMVLTEAVSDTTEVFVSIRKNTSVASDLVWDNSELDRSMLTLYIGAGQTSQRGSMMVPYDVTTGEQYYVHISSTSLSIEGAYEKVVVTRPQASIIIVTDLPLYRPGQIVLYRVIVVDMYLKPTMNKPVTVEIKDGNNSTILKTTSKSNKEFGDYGDSLVDGNFTLSDDPILGIYTITAMTADSYTERTFEVKKIVLPEFQVILQLDQDRLFDGDDYFVQISGKVIAKYSNGRSVKGRAVVKVTSGSGSLDDDAIVWADDNFSGSSLFTCTVDELHMYTHPYFQSQSYLLSAEMTEESSGKTEYANATLPMFRSDFFASVVKPIPMLFRGQETNYTFQVELKHYTFEDLDKNWTSEDFGYYKLCYKLSSDWQWPCINVNSNPVNVSLQIETSDTNIDDNAVQVEFSYYSDRYRLVIKSAWVEVKIAKYYTWSLQNISAELVHSQNENEKCFKLSPFELGDKAYYQLVNSYYQEGIHAYTNVNGHCFTPEQKHKPQTRIVVYKLVDFTAEEASGTELLTAYVDVNFEWTPEQEVSLTVTSEQGDAELKPGETAKIVVKTKDQALVSVKAVDKSIGCMAAANDFTTEQLEELREAFRPYGERENKHPNPPMFQMPISREEPMIEKTCRECPDLDKYMDSKKLLGEAGLTVITDLYLKHQEVFDPTPEHEFVKEVEAANKEKEDATKEIPDTLVWDLLLTDTNGDAQIIKHVPDNITSWEVNAFAMNSEHGLSVSETIEILDDNYAHERCARQEYKVQFEEDYIQQPGGLVPSDYNQQPDDLGPSDQYIPGNNENSSYPVTTEESVEYTSTWMTTGASSAHMNAVVYAVAVLFSLLKL